MGNHRGLLGNYPSNYVSYCISIYIIDKCNNSRTFCDLGVPLIALLGIGLYRVKVIRQIRIMAISIHGLKDLKI